MDGNHFDDVMRMASAQGSRRGILVVLTSGLLAAFSPAARAGKKKRNKKGGRRKRCAGGERCGGRCLAKCPNGMTRNPITCDCGCSGNDCGPGQECCGGSCADILFDDEHCGGCGIRCDSRTQTCSEGECRDICSLNEDYTVSCDGGGDYWCCPERSPNCCRLPGGEPHCC